jgi:excinuclease ABC subunit C
MGASRKETVENAAGITPRRVPTGPGVYLLKDANGRIIYVGKARNLRSRLRAYTGKRETPDRKTQILRSHLSTFDYIVTESETEALVLESNLIKEHRPRYNVKLKDDKRYPFIKVTLAERFPKAYVTRVVREDGARYFGPYTDARAMRRTLRLVRQIFPSRTCKTFKLRLRPCLNHQIGRCPAPCSGKVTEEQYGRGIEELCLFLSGRADEVVSRLEDRMQRAVSSLRFEEAATLRDRIADIDRVVERQRVLTVTRVDRDVVAIDHHEQYGVASVVRIRRGKMIGCENVPLEFAAETNREELLAGFLKQFYSVATELPPEILVDDEMRETEAIGIWLRERAGRAVSIHFPKRGEKLQLIAFARENAKTALRRAFDDRKVPKVIEDLGLFLGMKRPPRLISAVDISNIQGAHAVGTVISFRDAKPDKALYRKYRIRTVKGSDDCAMIYEVVHRHFSATIRERQDLPDLLLVDGGKGQLRKAVEAVREAGARGVTVVALAKREEELFVPGRAGALPVPDESAAKRLLRRIRNEVHRFSITYHRSLRKKAARRSTLDGIAGVGESRKAALLERFGSAAAILERREEEIAEVPGIGIRTARRIKQALEQETRGSDARQRSD